MKIKIPLLLLLPFLFASVTFARSPKPTDPAKGVVALAIALDDSLRIPSLRNGELGVLTFVDLNDLESAAPIGRYLQEKLLNQLFQRNFRVIEIRLGKEIAPTPPLGETSLTRVREKLKESNYKDLKGVIVGTYIQTASGLQVSARLVELENSQVRASGETLIARSRMLKSLMPAPAATPQPAADLSRAHEIYERMPVLPAPTGD